jgi:hypothetical protein
LLIGRPWEGSAGWPNRFLVPKATCNNPVPNTNAPASKMHTLFLGAATSALRSVRTQLAIALWEIVMRLLGGRGNRRGVTMTWHHSAAQMNELMANPSDGRETIGQAMHLPGASASCGALKMPNVQSSGTRGRPA